MEGERVKPHIAGGCVTDPKSPSRTESRSGRTSGNAQKTAGRSRPGRADLGPWVACSSMSAVVASGRPARGVLSQGRLRQCPSTPRRQGSKPLPGVISDTAHGHNVTVSGDAMLGTRTRSHCAGPGSRLANPWIDHAVEHDIGQVARNFLSVQRFSLNLGLDRHPEAGCDEHSHAERLRERTMLPMRALSTIASKELNAGLSVRW